MIIKDFYVLVTQGIAVYQTFNIKEAINIMQRENKEFEDYLLNLPDYEAPVDNRIYCYREVNDQVTHEVVQCRGCEQYFEFEVDDMLLEMQLCVSCYDDVRWNNRVER